MTFISIILGVLMIIGGFLCMFTPMSTFLSTGYFLCVMMLVYGVVGIVRFIRKESDVLQLVISVLSIIVGLIALFRPGTTLVFDSMVLTMIAVWLLVQGVITIVVSIKGRDYIEGWGWGVASGVLGIIAGIISFAHPALTAITAGMMIGIYFIESGVNMIVLGAALGSRR